MNHNGIDKADIAAQTEAHRQICIPDGRTHQVERHCPCLACIALCCEKCGTPVFAVPVTGLPGCEHFTALYEHTR